VDTKAVFDKIDSTTEKIFGEIKDINKNVNKIDTRLTVVETKIDNGHTRNTKADWISIAKAIGIVIAAGAAAAIGGASALQ
jgi:hypothetical protein